MNAKSSGNRDRRQFTEADYDFSGVGKSNLAACFVYEYARESRAARKKVTTIRKLLRLAKGKTIEVNVAPTWFHNLILMYLANDSGFPTIPWIRLSAKDQLRFLKVVGQLPKIIRMRLWAQNPPLSFVLNEPGTTTLQMWMQKYRESHAAVSDGDPIKFGFFAVNLKYGRAVLIEEFTGYLNFFEGKPMLEAQAIAARAVRPPGRRTYRDALNGLGAMRLRYYCENFTEAKEKMKRLQQKADGMIYGDRRSFNRACAAALKHFQIVFGLLDSQPPIHFTKGWQK